MSGRWSLDSHLQKNNSVGIIGKLSLDDSIENNFSSLFMTSDRELKD